MNRELACETSNVGDDDVPTGVDFRNPDHTVKWIATAEVRPGRVELRRAIADYIATLGRNRVFDTAAKPSVLELGGGPGFLAEAILAVCDVGRYVLLDFARPMLDAAAARLGDQVTYHLGDFLTSEWASSLQGPFDIVVSMQAVHELRHKRRAQLLYEQVRTLMRPGSVLVVCDHEPKDDARSRALHASAMEQIVAMSAAGFTSASVLVEVSGLYVVVCKAT